MRAPVVKLIYDLYLSGGVGITQIRNALNADPDRYPPPIPVDPARSLGAWSRSSIWEVLRNPKYTGYQVWNRRARKTAGNRERTRRRTGSGPRSRPIKPSCPRGVRGGRGPGGLEPPLSSGRSRP